MDEIGMAWIIDSKNGFICRNGGNMIGWEARRPEAV